MLDILFIHPNASSKIYQDLAQDHAAIEPPIWANMLTHACNNKGFNANLLDCEVNHYDNKAAILEIKEWFKPRLICFVIYGQQPSASTQNMDGAVSLAEDIKKELDIPIIFVGGHVAAVHEEVLERHPCVDYICQNEGVYTILELVECCQANPNPSFSDLHKIKGLGWRPQVSSIKLMLNAPSPVVPQDRLEEDLPSVAWNKLPSFSHYRTTNWHSFTNHGEKIPFASIYTSLGCPMKCLTGDTLVNTIYGNLSIKYIAKHYKTIPVYTYDKNTEKVFIADAYNIIKTGIQQDVIRVEFDDGTHIDCTPDHKFMTFTGGNKHILAQDYTKKASDLIPGTRIRAIKKYQKNNNYIAIYWKKRQQKKEHVMVMEYIIKRKLKHPEVIHHIDYDKSNNLPNNLKLCKNTKEHYKYHPEMSLNMKKAKPVQYRTKESYKKSKKSLHINQEINHKVTKVYKLQEKQDVYCMTVPSTGWFYANNVLVKNCDFCCINTINRTTYTPYSTQDSAIIRYWSPKFLIKQFDYFAEKGVRNIKIADELFILKPSHFVSLCNLIIERKYDFNMWCYGRVDTCQAKYLDILKKAGVNFIGLGIESVNKTVRQDVTKGGFKNVKIDKVIKDIENAGINVGANYIFGLPEDTYESMRETLDFAIDKCTAMVNTYSCFAYPGSKLYQETQQNYPQYLPTTYSGYSQHSYDCQPLPSKYLSAEEILRFRDDAWMKYHTNPKYLQIVREKFGEKAYNSIVDAGKIKLKRKILGD